MNPQEHYTQVLTELKTRFNEDPDPGLHAAVEWLLKKWGEKEWLQNENCKLSCWELENVRLRQIKQGLEDGQTPEKLQWYVNGQNQTMVVIPSPVTFWMGSRVDEIQVDENEPYHLRKINKAFAIASKEVTVQQFEKSELEHDWEFVKRKRLGDPDLPIIGVTWYQAAEYCNWVSQKEEIPKDQWCYEVIDKVMTIKPNYAMLTGYRLPTEAEWEYAARAGANTLQFFGQTEELMTKYVWFRSNSNNKPAKVGLLKPNDFGLFDVLGNQSEWCLEPYCDFAPKGNSNEIIIKFHDGVSIEAEIEESKESDDRAIRGGSHISDATDVRVSKRTSNNRDENFLHYGFRVARYLR